MSCMLLRPKERPFHLPPLFLMKFLHCMHPTTITQAINTVREAHDLLGIVFTGSTITPPSACHESYIYISNIFVWLRETRELSSIRNACHTPPNPLLCSIRTLSSMLIVTSSSYSPEANNSTRTPNKKRRKCYYTGPSGVRTS